MAGTWNVLLGWLAWKGPGHRLFLGSKMPASRKTKVTAAWPSVTVHRGSPFLSITRRAALTRACIGLACAPIAGLLMEILREGLEAAPIDSSETLVVLPKNIEWVAWPGLPARTGEMAPLYGGLNTAGPYVVFMKWYPGNFSAPHTYATDRLSVVVSGTWWVNSGGDFDPGDCVPVSAGGFVRRVAHTPHYDGVMKHAKGPAVIALFGMGPVDLKLVDPSKPAWRRL